MVTFEQVQKLCEHAHISYEEAKKALEETNGDMLEAVINLEKQNRIKAPESGGYYNSQEESQGGRGFGRGKAAGKNRSEANSSSFGEQLKIFLKWCGKMLHKGNINSFEVVKEGNTIMMIPLTVLALLLIFAFWIMIPLLIIGLFFGYRYQFKGPDLEKTQVNQAMDNVSNATLHAVDTVVNAVDNLSKECKKNKDENDGEDTDY